VQVKEYLQKVLLWDHSYQIDTCRCERRERSAMKTVLLGLLLLIFDLAFLPRFFPDIYCIGCFVYPVYQ